MTGRADPERIYLARRAATFTVLTQTRAIASSTPSIG
jgi:hypothetical protein